MESSNKVWFSAKELEGLNLPELPKHATNITRKALKENWKKRTAMNVKGGGFEYHITALPKEAQVAIGYSNENRDKLRPVLQLKQTARTPMEGEAVVNIDKFKEAIETLEEILIMTNKQMTPDGKAAMIWGIYELLTKQVSEKDRMMGILKLVA